MGNCFSRKYISKDNFHAEPDVYQDCPQEATPGGDTAEIKAEKLKNECALSIKIDDKLKMVKEETGFIGPGGTQLFKMKNLTTNSEGLVLEDSVAKVGTVECEK